MTSFHTLLAALLITLLPHPTTSKAIRSLTSSEVGDILGEIQNAVDLLRGPEPPSLTREGSLPDRLSPSHFPVGMLVDSQHLPGWLSKERADPSSSDSAFPRFSYGGDAEHLAKRADTDTGPDMASPFIAFPPSAVDKRNNPDLCHMLGFPMSNGCRQRRLMQSAPQTRSGSALLRAVRKSSPSLYLFGGALGR